VHVTPLQMARLVAAVGNGGTLYEPQFVQEVRPAEGGAPSYTFQPVISSTLPLSTTQLAAIQTGMLNVLKEPIGTARNRFRGFRICVAGKTGTAEDPGLFGEQDPDAWFVGYTCAGRADKPDIAVAVVVQNRGQGSDYAAPIFRRVLEAYFGLPYVRYPWETAVGVPAPEATATPEPGAEAPTASP
jgi:penicillin-binding protein 2